MAKRMGQANGLLLLYSSLFCLLIESQQAQSTQNKNNEANLHANYTSTQIFGKVNLPSSLNNPKVVFVEEVVNHVTNSLPESKQVQNLVSVDTRRIRSLDEPHYNSINELAQTNTMLLKSTLKKINKQFNKWRKLKHEKLTKQATLFGSPFQGCSKTLHPTSESKTIKKYEVNLEAKPEERWKQVVKENIVQMRKLADFFDSVFGPVVMSVVDTGMTWLHYSLPSEYYRELNGLSTYSGISVARVTLYNVFYELFTLCTSIVMEGKDGKMYHGRNLDFGLFLGWDAKNHTWFITEILRPLIIKVDFMKNGKPLYSAVTYAGYTGILTGLKKDAFSLTIDERFVANGGYVGLLEWTIGLRDCSWLGLLTRRVMESAATYDEAQQLLSDTPLVAPVYFILAGNSSHQGSVVTRGRRDADVWPLGSRHKQQQGSWFLVQTNYDHWRETPFYDHRRQYAVQCMDQLGQDKPLDTLYRVLSTKPILNKETTLTAVMDVREGLLQVWKRDCPDPCWPL